MNLARINDLGNLNTPCKDFYNTNVARYAKKLVLQPRCLFQNKTFIGLSDNCMKIIILSLLCLLLSFRFKSEFRSENFGTGIQTDIVNLEALKFVGVLGPKRNIQRFNS